MPQIIKQVNQYTCYLACLESFMRDNGLELDQLATVAAHPDLFAGGEAIEGSCSNAHWEEAAKRLGLNFEWFQGNIQMSPQVGIILGCFWGGDQGQAHVVRLLGATPQGYLVMNPSGDGSIHVMPTGWVQIVAKVTIPAPAPTP